MRASVTGEIQSGLSIETPETERHPNEASNSIGNLILHLCGNARQWIIAGVGGAADTRQRVERVPPHPGV